MKQLGCLVVVVVLAAGLYWTRPLWLPRITGKSSTTATLDGVWQPLTTEGAGRARQQLTRLRGAQGPVYVDVGAGDLGAYIYEEITGSAVREADSAQAMVRGDRLLIRAIVPLSQFGDRSALGPLGALLGDREQLQLGGRLRVIRPGLSELIVDEMRVRDLSIPQALIQRLVERLRTRASVPGLSERGLAIRTPEYIGDARVGGGEITLYKTSVAPAAPATPPVNPRPRGAAAPR